MWDDGYWICIHKRFEVPEQEVKTIGWSKDCAKIAKTFTAYNDGDNIFIDVGANIGVCTLLMASLGIFVL